MKLYRKLLPKVVRGLLSLSVFLGICAMLFPLPIASLPPISPKKDSSEPFPCQNRPCGCLSAEQCWKKCCCFNNAQKIAWAKLNNVKVPDFVVAAAKKESRTVAEVSSRSRSSRKSASTKHSGGCSHCEQEPVVVAKSPCCRKSEVQAVAKSHTRESCSNSAEKSPEARRKPTSSKWVMADCHNGFHNFAITSARSAHVGGVQVALVDGSVRFVSENLDLTIWRGIATRDGGEVISEF